MFELDGILEASTCICSNITYAARHTTDLIRLCLSEVHHALIHDYYALEYDCASMSSKLAQQWQLNFYFGQRKEVG